MDLHTGRPTDVDEEAQTVTANVVELPCLLPVLSLSAELLCYIWQYMMISQGLCHTAQKASPKLHCTRFVPAILYTADLQQVHHSAARPL